MKINVRLILFTVLMVFKSVDAMEQSIVAIKSSLIDPEIWNIKYTLHTGAELTYAIPTVPSEDDVYIQTMKKNILSNSVYIPNILPNNTIYLQKLLLLPGSEIPEYMLYKKKPVVDAFTYSPELKDLLAIRVEVYDLTDDEKPVIKKMKENNNNGNPTKREQKIINQFKKWQKIQAKEEQLSQAKKKQLIIEEYENKMPFYQRHSGKISLVALGATVYIIGSKLGWDVKPS